MRRNFEVEDWEKRALEIDALQELRFQVITQLMCNQQKNREAINNKKLHRLLVQREKQKVKAIEKIRSKCAEEIRRMIYNREKKQRGPKPDMIDLFSEPCLPTLLSAPRKGGKEGIFKVRSQFLETLEGLSEMEKLISDKTKNIQIDIKTASKYNKDGSLKQFARWQSKLESLHKYMEAQRCTDTEPPKPFRYLFRIEKHPPRPLTPSIPEIDKSKEEVNVAILNLQRLIRGRAIQTMMREARLRRQLLIDELRSTHALVKDERAEKRRQMLQIRIEQTRFENLKYENDKTHEILERLDTTVLGNMLDLLSKELDRLIVDQRLSEFVHRAREERRMREVEESSRRQWELRRRREQEEFFKQILKVHQDTADGYFEALLSYAMEYSAELIATDEIEELAKQWTVDVKETEQNLTHEEEAAELVYNFLIPEVNRRFYREELQRQERKYLNAAHQEIFDELESNQLSAQIRGYQELRIDQSVSVDDEAINNEMMAPNADEQVEDSSLDAK
ncbi:unnamed protein product [Rodentolepis nana]|uniref:Cilia- and flagella-associated protein 91 n=1 Tax=Rodentolepis nana TaxID=102285 RepID=A0A0R3TN99_RODNA|nr:unnamed protein product [Rodentolepis nana]